MMNKQQKWLSSILLAARSRQNRSDTILLMSVVSTELCTAVRLLIVSTSKELSVILFYDHASSHFPRGYPEVISLDPPVLQWVVNISLLFELIKHVTKKQSHLYFYTHSYNSAKIDRYR